MDKFGKLTDDEEDFGDWGGTPPGTPPTPPDTPEPSGEDDGGFGFQPEVNVYDRVGMPGVADVLSNVILSGDNLSDLQRKINKMVQDPMDRFMVYVDAISRNISSAEKGIVLDNNDIIRMLKNAKKIKNVQYKNPSAYILGYLASEGGKEMKKENVANVIKKGIPLVREGNVEPPDVVRYARYWMNL